MGLLRDLYRRFLLARHLPRHWHVRPRTLDGRIVRHVLLDNEYRLPDRFAPEDVIVDIGAHIGSFALAALKRGAGKVHCFEPEPENFALLSRNLSPYADSVCLHQAAVWRERETRSLHLYNPLTERNTGAHQIALAEPGMGIDILAFDDMIDEIANSGRRIRLLKLDCEGAEWPILLTSRRLERIEAICGEYHLGPLPETFAVEGIAAFSADLLCQVLAGQQFHTTIEELPPRPYPCGLFFASRESVGCY